MKKIVLGLMLVSLFMVGFVSANTVDFYYSPSCPHCQKISPLIDMLSKKTYSSKWEWNFFDVSKGNYGVQGVPTLIINKKIKLVGSEEIPRYTECYLNEQSTKNCPTYSADSCTQDWFIRG